MGELPTKIIEFYLPIGNVSLVLFKEHDQCLPTFCNNNNRPNENNKDIIFIVLITIRTIIMKDIPIAKTIKKKL